MNAPHELACEILESMNIAILRRTGPRTYDFFGKLPDFYSDIFCDETGKPSCEPWTLSPMLDFFLDDAEDFFTQKKTGILSSGMWQEDGKTTEGTALISMAATYGENQVLIIRMLEKDYQERIIELSKARIQLLENRSLSSNLEYYKEKSRIDDLTKIFNKATFMDLLQKEIKHSFMVDHPLALLMIDIDDFKRVNDTYGHLIGDEVLKNIGLVLSDTLRQDDIVARFGGEEFTVLVPQVNEKQALNVAEKLRKKIAETMFKDIPGLTVSIGCSLYTPRETMENFIARADAALYAAKKSGKNKVCLG